MKRLLPLLMATLLLTAAACGDDDGAVQPGSAGDDMPTAPTDGPLDDPDIEPIDEGDEFPTEQAREDARIYLGMNESDLPDEVRIGRRGDEQFMLTEDYRLGRVTVELDDTDGSGYRVTSLVIELPDGPETLELEPS